MKKAKMLFVVIALTVIFTSIGATYSYYVDSSEAKSKLNIANWVIKLNKTDITLEESKTFSITDMTYLTKDVVLPDGTTAKNHSERKFCPGSIMYFNIELDATESMVALDFDIDVDISAFDNPNIVVKNGEFDGGKITQTGNSFHGEMALNNVRTKKAVIAIYLEWLDTEDYLDEDLALGTKAGNQISVPVAVRVKQYSE